MKKVISLLLALLLLLVPMTAYADQLIENPQTGDELTLDDPTEVIANANASYIIVIPEVVDFGTISRLSGERSIDFPVRITDALLDANAFVSVSVSSGFTMHDMNGNGSTPLAYKLFNVGENGTELVTGDSYCVFKAGICTKGEVPISEATLSAEKVGRVTTNAAELKRAGTYSDTMVFVCSYTDPVAAASKYSGAPYVFANSPQTEEINGVKTVNINSADDFISFAETIRNYAPFRYQDTVVEINCDMNLAGYNWTSINAMTAQVSGMTLDGNGHTIYNFSCVNDGSYLSGHGAAMFYAFGQSSSPLTIKDLSFVNAKSQGSGISSAILVGYNYATLILDNVDIYGGSSTSRYKVASYVGSNNGSGNAHITMNNCDIYNFTSTGLAYGAYDVCGMIAWSASNNGDTVNFSNCTMNGVDVVYDTSTGNYTEAAIVYVDDQYIYNECVGVTITDCEIIAK